MGKIEILKGELLHATGDAVETIEVILKGSIRVSDSSFGITLNDGGMVGIAEKPGGTYQYDYDVTEDTILYSYTYENQEDICSILKLNPQISHILTENAVRAALDTYDAASGLFEETDGLYQELTSAYETFPELCSQAGEIYRPFPGFEKLEPPSIPDFEDWEREYFQSLSKEQYNLGMNFCTGTVMFAVGYIRCLTQQIELISDYSMHLNEESADFRIKLHQLKSRLAEIKHSAEATRAKFVASNEASLENKVVIKNALDTILSYSGIPANDAGAFRKLISAFNAAPDKADTSDDARQLRRSIAACFYRIYEGAFIKSMTDREIPVELKMFFYYGFVDEKLAGSTNTAALAGLAETYRPDPSGHVILIYEWLKMIYDGRVEPSKNEFDLEYPAYLKECYQNGEISDKEMKERLNDPAARVSFEIKNLFTMANRMTFGSISSFVPVFFGDEMIKAPSEAIVTYRDITENIDRIRSIDFSCFCRETVFSDTSIGVTREFIQTEVLPYMILMPNAGIRGALWQEISGSRRNTPARMLMPVFPSKDPFRILLELAGDFRWEMCRREQGVHWNDVTVPSLTSEYSDYIQFYRKNHELSAENKDKIKLSLQSARNSTKHVFLLDYINYVEFESAGSSRLNKVARGLLFKYCPFPAKTRAALALSSPAYADIVERYKIKQNQKIHLIDIVMQKITKTGATVPLEIYGQYQFLQK